MRRSRRIGKSSYERDRICSARSASRRRRGESRPRRRGTSSSSRATDGSSDSRGRRSWFAPLERRWLYHADRKPERLVPGFARLRSVPVVGLRDRALAQLLAAIALSLERNAVGDFPRYLVTALFERQDESSADVTALVKAGVP